MRRTRIYEVDRARLRELIALAKAVGFKRCDRAGLIRETIDHARAVVGKKKTLDFEPAQSQARKPSAEAEGRADLPLSAVSQHHALYLLPFLTPPESGYAKLPFPPTSPEWARVWRDDLSRSLQELMDGFEYMLERLKDASETWSTQASGT